MTTTGEEEGQVLRFRNYVPKNEALRQLVVKISSVPSRDMEVLLSEARNRAKILSGDDKPVLVPPKRLNWDLKRDTEKRLKRLTKRTQHAISVLAEELQREKQDDEED